MNNKMEEFVKENGDVTTPPKKRRRTKKPPVENTVVDNSSDVTDNPPQTKKQRRKKTPKQDTETAVAVTPVSVKRIPTPYELFYDEGLSKTGWAGLLHPLYKEVERWNKDKKEGDYKFTFSQIKEKYGSLCLYNFGATEEQWKRIKMCEKASNHICMLCGSPFKVGKTQAGWITTMCDECAKKEIDAGILDKEEWKIYYDSIRITPIIKIALKLQKIGFKLDKIKDDINYFIYCRKGRMKFLFYHYVLKSDKYDNTLFNYKKYKTK